MAEPNLDIDRLVREVMARLGGQPAAAATAARELIVSTKVVTLDEIDGKLDGVQSVVIAARAVVTPAVRDLLRERKIRLTQRAPAAAAGKSPVRLAMGVADTTFDPTEILSGVKKTGVTIERLANTGMTSVVNEMTDQVARGGALGLLFTNRAAAAVCLANRIRGVRAVTGSEQGSLTRAIAAAGANLLAIDPAEFGGWALKRTVAEFCRQWPRECPAELKDR